MPHTKCVVCKSEKPRFNFPTDTLRRRKWLKLLNVNLTVIKDTSKLGKLCSKHFNENDILISPEGKHSLRKDTVPLPFNDGTNHVPGDLKLKSSDNIQFDCHKVILAANSKLFEEVLKEEESIVILPDINSEELESMLKFMYTGSCHVRDLEEFYSIFKAFGIDTRSHVTVEKRENRVVKLKHNKKPIKRKVSKINDTEHGKNELNIGQSVLPRGLSNNSNCCYANCILQCLLHCEQFYKLMMELSNDYSINIDSSTPILKSMIEFFKNYCIIRKSKQFETGGCLDPNNLYKKLFQHEPFTNFQHGRQEDAQEFLISLLDGISDEIKKLKLKSTEGVNGVQPLTTPIQDLFMGRNKSVTRITGKAYVSTNLESYYTMAINIEDEEVHSIEDALVQDYSKEEIIEDFKCPLTGKVEAAQRNIKLKQLPKILIIHLKRFKFVEGQNQKILKNVSYGPTLNIPTSILSDDCTCSQGIYKLQSVVYHKGFSAQNGHYITNIKHHGFGWIACDDTKIHGVTEKSVLSLKETQNPYLLVYTLETVPRITNNSVQLLEDSQIVSNTSLGIESSPKMPVLSPQVLGNETLESSPQRRSMPPLLSPQTYPNQEKGTTMNHEEGASGVVCKGVNCYFLDISSLNQTEASYSDNFNLHANQNMQNLFQILEHYRPVMIKKTPPVASSKSCEGSNFKPSFKGNRFSQNDIRDAATIMYSSGKCYRFIKENSMIPLPSKRTVRKRTESFVCPPGDNKELLKLLKSKVDEEGGKTSVIISFDEMEIHKEASYSQKLRYLFPPHKVCPKFYHLIILTVSHQFQKLMVVMVRGLTTKGFKQVIKYDFDINMTKKYLMEIIKQCEEVGAQVRGVVLDMGNHTFLSDFGKLFFAYLTIFIFELQAFLEKIITIFKTPAEMQKYLFSQIFHME